MLGSESLQVSDYLLMSACGGAVKRSAPPPGSPGKGVKTQFINSMAFQGPVDDLLSARVALESSMWGGAFKSFPPLLALQQSWKMLDK